MNKPSGEVFVRSVPSLSREMPVWAKRGPNGLVEIMQANAFQGWHSGYVTPERARELAADLERLAGEVEVAA